MNEPEPAQSAARGLSFAAMRHQEFRWFFFTYVLAMMADNIEHVISYWVMYRKFHSAALGGFAVLSHWLPYLFFSVAVGGLGDRLDPRRIIQTGMILFVAVSLGWSYFFITDSLQAWQAMLLLVCHGFAGLLWQTSSQLLLHNIVPPSELQSAVRLNATARYLGVLVGPAVGGAMLIGLGAAHGMLLNTLYYLPMILWLFRAPFVRSSAAGAARSAVRGIGEIVRTWKDVSGRPELASMMVLAGAASFFVGNSYQAQMPGFAHDLGHGDPGTAYSSLLAADAAGALVAGFLLETVASLSTKPRTALLLALGWCVALATFAVTRSYPLALVSLFMAGFFELSFSSMAQTVVQLSAPAESRGRILGLYAMAGMGCRAFSGITVGLIGALLGVHVALNRSALVLMAIIAFLLARQRRKAVA